MELPDEPVEIAKAILQKVKLLEFGRKDLERRAKEKADAIGDYAKEFEKKVLTLKEQGMQLTILRDIAKGECYEEEMAKDLAESMYKIGLVKLDTIKAEMNGLQSINKHLQEL